MSEPQERFSKAIDCRRLRRLGHVCRMEDGGVPKDILYSLKTFNQQILSRGHRIAPPGR